MVTLDFSGMSVLVPVFGFILVFTVVYALLSKTEALGKNRFVHIVASFAVAAIFVVSTSAVKYVSLITPWFAAFVISLLFIALIVGLIRPKLDDFFVPGFAWFLVAVLIIIFVASAAVVFGDVINKYLAGPKHFALSPTVIGFVVLIGLGIIAAYLVTRK